MSDDVFTGTPDRPNSPSRRTFLQAAGATIAGLNAAACIRKPYEKIMPFGKRPEDLLPGEPKYYATAFSYGASVIGVLAKSTDGRPTKIEGNPQHPFSGGRSNVFAQASVLSLYAPERSQTARERGSEVERGAAEKALGDMAAAAKKAEGEGLAVLVDDTPSPTLNRLLGELQSSLPKARLYQHDGAGDANARAGAAMVGAGDVAITAGGNPHVIAAFDADPMSTEGDAVAFTRMFAAGRAPHRKADANRLYVAEPYVSVTGMNADHRLAVRGGEVVDVLAAVSEALRAQGLDLPAVSAPKAKADLPFVEALAKDLASRPKGSTLVTVGERQPAHAHALALLINGALGNLGSTVILTPRNAPAMGSLADLAGQMEAGTVKQLVVLGGNPVLDAPADVDFAALMGKVESSFHLGSFVDETGSAAAWHLPQSHYLEAWGDLVARDGTVSIQQPLIAPLHPSLSAVEVVSRLMGSTTSGYDLVRATYEPLVESNFEKAWMTWLHDGVVLPAKVPNAEVALDAAGLAWTPGAAADGYEVDFVRDPTTLDGRYGFLPWLQELPDPVTKLVWDNAALMSPSTAEKLGVENEALIDVSVGDASARLPVWVQPGVADGVVAVATGYGREGMGKFAASGTSVESIRGAAAFASASVAKASGSYSLACVQVETSLYDRPHHRSATRTDFTEEPNFVEKFEIMDESHIESLLWEQPNETDGHQWAMVIDLNSCTGCGTCTVACQAENNIPWVGKEDCKNGREMHWIRVDRYFEETARNVQVKVQPLACAHCETAPCENVCPVGATVHSPEGMNDMAYNRCIGTRYCANNCPYKVRRFNFFHYAVRNDGDYGMGIAMQRNPDVTVRYRGVMEKCTYCVQRVNRARIDAKVNRDGVIRDGEVTTACAQACPAEAITFGDMNDPKSAVSVKRADPRNYEVMAELNIGARTTYLAKLSNPNPELEEA